MAGQKHLEPRTSAGCTVSVGNRGVCASYGALGMKILEASGSKPMKWFSGRTFIPSLPCPLLAVGAKQLGIPIGLLITSALVQRGWQ